MRIIAGKYRHRIIEMTNLESTRETQDKVRGAIFNMVGPYFDGGNALDLFAGSGALGIEAYSRGISKVWLNDLNKNALDVCKKNVNSLQIKNDFIFTNLDYTVFCQNTNVKFNLVLLDPPYKMDNIFDIIKIVYPVLENDGILVFEAKKESLYPLEYEDLKLWKNKEYGIKRVIVYRRLNDEV